MSHKKTIWLINFYASTLDAGIGGRCYYFAKYLAEEGYDVYLFSAATNHLLRHKPKFASSEKFLCEKVDGFNYVWIKALDYKGAHSKLRLLSEVFFSHQISQLYKHDFPKPSTILFSSPALLAYPGALRLAKKTNAKLIFDVRDLWPLTLIEMGGYSSKHPLISYMQKVEDKAYKTADVITSNWPFAIDYMEEHYADRNKFYWIPNGFSIEEFSASEKIEPEFFNKIPKDKFIIGYTGTLGKANALSTLLNSAEILKEHKNIAFVIVGDGREKEDLINEINSRTLDNVHYVGSVAKYQIPNVLSLFDACYVGLLDIPLYRLGSSLTKLPEYLASKKPIIYASNSPFQPVEDAKAGISVKAENTKEVVNAILKLYNMPNEELKMMGENGYASALKNYEYKMLTQKLINVLFPTKTQKNKNYGL